MGIPGFRGLTRLVVSLPTLTSLSPTVVGHGDVGRNTARVNRRVLDLPCPLPWSTEKSKSKGKYYTPDTWVVVCCPVGCDVRRVLLRGTVCGRFLGSDPLRQKGFMLSLSVSVGGHNGSPSATPHEAYQLGTRTGPRPGGRHEPVSPVGDA